LDDLKKKLQGHARAEAARQEIERMRKEAEEKAAKPDPDDPRNKAKTAELQLEEFEKHRYDQNLKDKLGWDQKKVDEFLAAEAERVEQLKKLAAQHEEALKDKDKGPKGGEPPLTAGGGTKLGKGMDSASGVTGSGATVAPPGFEDPKVKFAKEAIELLKKKQ